MVVQCPGCRARFDTSLLDFGEEVLNPNISVVRKTTERSSWAAIAEEIQSGHAYRAVSVGDEIPFRLKNGENVVAVAAHENPYWNNSMAFVIKECLKDRCQMNATNTNRGGYAATKMRKHLIEDIVPLLPDELVSVIKPRTIVQKYNPTDIDGLGAEYKSSDLIWIPSRTEIVGPHEYFKDIDYGDTHFDFFINEKSRVKMLGDETYSWWLRSASSGYTFYTVANSGGGTSNGASASNGVVFGFLI